MIKISTITIPKYTGSSEDTPLTARGSADAAAVPALVEAAVLVAAWKAGTLYLMPSATASATRTARHASSSCAGRSRPMPVSASAGSGRWPILPAAGSVLDGALMIAREAH